MDSKAFNRSEGRINEMAQKVRLAEQITDKEFDRLTELIVKENRKLFERLAEVWRNRDSPMPGEGIAVECLEYC